ncbi:MAG: 50S ribosomal protein L9 [Acidobacteriota bacterium]|nr:50S ribosomal protein L9 [Acidobacteriota bacterium]MXX87372.1 50S ribosomal protein L9 [Acidobacteriota bacterium]MYG74359.1 50S ribosomal protein L9 [Acidobacteriota bacterium]
MRLLLKQPVEALGEPGDEVNVRPGYARNYLLPRRIAVPITEENRREVADARKVWAVERIKEREAAEALARSLEGHTLRFERRVKTDSNELYGSVSVQDIARQLAEGGFEIARNRIILGGPIKVAGQASAVVRLHSEIEVDLPIEVSPVAAGSLGVEPLPDIPTEVSAKRAAEPESDDDEVAASSEEADDPED